MDIKNKIKSILLEDNKNMRLDIFLKNVLYGENGYYNKQNPIGKNFDFITSPEISQMFGEIIGMYIFYIWRTNINSNFNLIELGPGKITLFKDIYRSVSNYPIFFDKAKVLFVEINKELLKRQKAYIEYIRLKNVKWSENIDFKSQLPSIIYSNEFFDCFPVRQFTYDEMWHEKFVRYNKEQNKFYLENKLVKDRKLLLYLKKYQKQKVAEISFDRNKYFEKICKFIKKRKGIFLTIDYGYTKPISYFTLQAIQNHKYSHIFENIGEIDISSHVNFDDFKIISKNYNLKIEEFCSQREFLIKYGILERNKKLSKFKNVKGIGKDLDRLINKKKMGNLFKFLIVSNF